MHVTNDDLVRVFSSWARCGTKSIVSRPRSLGKRDGIILNFLLRRRNLKDLADYTPCVES